MMLNEHLLEFKCKKLDSQAKPPSKSKGDIGWDLSCIEDDSFSIVYSGNFGEREGSNCYELAAGSRHLFKTGIAIELPEGYHGILKPRSGLAVKYGIDVLAGVVDNGWRGDVSICLQNNGSETVKICAGDRIAQMIIVKENEGYFTEVNELSETERQNRGFGSSGR